MISFKDCGRNLTSDKLDLADNDHARYRYTHKNYQTIKLNAFLNYHALIDVDLFVL